MNKFLPKSFKNKILVSILLFIIAVIIVIGVLLQLTVFPKVRGDSTVIWNLKAIHFIVGFILIGISWVFIEFISKRITLPLSDLTRRADQISRQAGEELGLNENVTSGLVPDERKFESDEINKLTNSFNRMLTYLKASEDRLRESEAKYRFLFDNGPLPIFVIDFENLGILDVNARAAEEYQYTRDELLNMSFADLGLDRDREATRKRLQQLFSTEVTLLSLLQHKRKDGSVFMVNYQACLSSYRDQPAIIAAVWDVTERLERYTRLLQASKMATLGEMATGVAHELNQPLNIIQLACDYMVKRTRMGKPLNSDELNMIARECVGSVDRASKIINHLRQFGRMSDWGFSKLDINEPIRRVFSLLGAQLKSRGINLRLDLDENLPEINGDMNRLEQVLINLALNSRDALLTGNIKEKAILVRSFSENDNLIVEFSDTGPGIPENIRERVFEPFFTTKLSGEGTGLGLSISYTIIKEHHATIEIDPDAKSGATFRLTFPKE